VAATAAAALMLLSSTHYGLVIADWLLPDGDGIYIADRALALRSPNPDNHRPPPGICRRAPGSAHRLLSKPVKPAELIAVVRDMIGEPPVSFLSRKPLNRHPPAGLVRGRLVKLSGDSNPPSGSRVVAKYA